MLCNFHWPTISKASVLPNTLDPNMPSYYFIVIIMHKNERTGKPCTKSLLCKTLETFGFGNIIIPYDFADEQDNRDFLFISEQGRNWNANWGGFRLIHSCSARQIFFLSNLN